MQHPEHYQSALAAIGADATTSELLDALVMIHDQLGDLGWARVLAILSARHRELLQCFAAEPERRTARAPVFGRLPLGWVNRYRKAPADERAAIEQMVPWLPWYRGESDEVLRRHGADADHSVERLQRLWVRALHERPPAVIAALRRMQGSDTEARETVAAIMHCQVSPFALSPLLRDPDRFVRLRASIALRRRLGESVPRGMVEQLAADPLAHSASASNVPAPKPTAERLEALRTELAGGQRPDVSLLYAATPAQRRECAEALLAAVRPQGRDAAVLSHLPHMLEISSAWELSALRFALASDPSLLENWLYGALQDGEVEHARWRVTLAAMVVHEMPLTVACDVAPLLLALLAGRDAATTRWAAQLAAVAMLAGEVPELRAEIVARALAAVPQLGTMRMGRSMESFCGSGEPTPGPPEDATAILMLVALRSGEVDLRAPWIDALAAVRGAADRNQHQAHEYFLLRGLVDIAAALDAETADRAWLLLKTTPKLGAEVPVSNRQNLELHALVGLLASVSEALVPEVIERLRAMPEQVQRAAVAGVRVPPPRLCRFLEAVGFQASTASLHKACPDLLAKEWSAGGERAVAVARLVASFHDGTWTEEQWIRGRLPRALVAEALARSSSALGPGEWPLSLLAACREEAVLTPQLPDRLETLAVHAVDLPRWRDLALAQDPRVALTACRRLEELGDAGRPALQEALRELCQKAADPTVRAQALTLAVDLGIDIPDLDSCLAALASSHDPVVRSHALALRLRAGQLAIHGLPLDHAFGALVLAGHVFTEADRARFRDTMREHVLAQLARGADSRTLARVIEGAALLPRWSIGWERVVCTATTHAAPTVRAAAYRALASRDPELWACAGLVAGAEFDSDPIVRALASPR